MLVVFVVLYLAPSLSLLSFLILIAPLAAWEFVFDAGDDRLQQVVLLSNSFGTSIAYFEIIFFLYAEVSESARGFWIGIAKRRAGGAQQNQTSYFNRRQNATKTNIKIWG